MRTTLRRAGVAVLGSGMTILGIVMLFTPGPAIVVIPAGLALLATEFPGVRRLLKRVRKATRG